MSMSRAKKHPLETRLKKEGVSWVEWSVTGIERDMPPDDAFDRPIKIF